MNEFNIDKRKARVTNVNTRTEKHGDRDVPAFDLSVTVPISGDEIASYFKVPQAVVDAMYDDNDNLVAAALSPVAVHRSPDDLQVYLFDEAGEMLFERSKAKGIRVDLDHSNRRGEMSLKVQFAIDDEAIEDADECIARIVHLQKQDCEISVESAQGDLFDDEEEEASEDE